MPQLQPLLCLQSHGLEGDVEYIKELSLISFIDALLTSRVCPVASGEDDTVSETTSLPPDQ